MRQFEEFIRFFFGMIIGLFVGPIIVGYMIILAIISELRERCDNNKLKLYITSNRRRLCYVAPFMER